MYFDGRSSMHFSWVILLVVTTSVVVCSSFTIISQTPQGHVPPLQTRHKASSKRRNTGTWRRSKVPSSGTYFHASSRSDITDDEALQRTRKQLDILKGATTKSSYVDNVNSDSINGDTHIQAKEELYQQLIKRPANELKEELKTLSLPLRGRKPDLARRLVDHIIKGENEETNFDQEDHIEPETFTQWENNDSSNTMSPIEVFASITLSDAAGMAFARAGFTKPTSIQSTAVPLLTKKRESLIIHAETGSGKTLAYLLPITESLWNDKELGSSDTSYALILTPTRELAAQVAGVARALSPPNSVRLVTTPTNLVRPSYEEKERSESDFGGRFDSIGTSQHAGKKVIVGSAKSILTSLFGDSKMPAPPTSKPEAKAFLRSVEYLVMDEVDRLLDTKKVRGKTSKYFKKHEKPAAAIASSIARMTLGKVQIVAVSATVGRSLRRELARVLGLTPDECPQVIRGSSNEKSSNGITSSRAITVPKTLKHFVLPCDGSTSGGLLTAAAFLVKGLPQINGRGRRSLFVVANGCGIKLKDAIGALKHFGVSPEPKSLLDVMEATGTDNLIEAYQNVSGSSGIGESSTSGLALSGSTGYLLLSTEDTVRGIHLDNLDSVIIVGRPKGPDEYIHIAGRAGRAGKVGNVVNVVSFEQAAALSSWETMLGINFIPCDENDVREIF